MVMADMFKKGRITSISDIILETQKNMSEENEMVDNITIQISDFNFTCVAKMDVENNALHRRFSFSIDVDSPIPYYYLMTTSIIIYETIYSEGRLVVFARLKCNSEVKLMA